MVIRRSYTEKMLFEVFLHRGFALGYYREGEFEHVILLGPIALYWSTR